MQACVGLRTTAFSRGFIANGYGPTIKVWQFFNDYLQYRLEVCEVSESFIYEYEMDVTFAHCLLRIAVFYFIGR